MNRTTRKPKPPTARAHAQLQEAHNNLAAMASAQREENVLLHNRINQLTNEAVSVAKELASTKQTRDFYSTQLTAARDALEEAHTLLDGLPEPPARKLPATNTYSGEREISLTARIATWLATRSAR